MGMRQKDNVRFPAVMTALGIALIALAVISLAFGRYPIGLQELVGIVWDQVLAAVESIGRLLGWDLSGIRLEPFWQATQEALFLKYRLPRVLLACMVGSSLATAGATYQGVFQNPMASPDILGASSGAAFGASLAIVLNLPFAFIGIMAFVGSLLTVAVVMYVGHKAPGNRVIGLILAGVMISSLASSGTSFIKLIADTEEQLPAITYWLMGSFNSAAPEDILYAGIPMLIGLVPIVALRWRINVLSLGDDEARTLGINPTTIRAVLIVSAALITAASVSVSGIIGWVGLVVPHMVRFVVGNDYKKLIPATLLCGAGFMLVVDSFCRNLWTIDLPVGILTSFVGAPFFLYLIMRGGKRL